MTDEELVSKMIDTGLFNIPNRHNPRIVVTSWTNVGILLDHIHSMDEPYKWIVIMRDIRRLSLKKPLERNIIEICLEHL